MSHSAVVNRICARCKVLATGGMQNVSPSFTGRTASVQSGHRAPSRPAWQSYAMLCGPYLSHATYGTTVQVLSHHRSDVRSLKLLAYQLQLVACLTPHKHCLNPTHQELSCCAAVGSIWIWCAWSLKNAQMVTGHQAVDQSGPGCHTRQCGCQTQQQMCHQGPTQPTLC